MDLRTTRILDNLLAAPPKNRDKREKIQLEEAHRTSLAMPNQKSKRQLSALAFLPVTLATLREANSCFNSSSCFTNSSFFLPRNSCAFTLAILTVFFYTRQK